MITWAILLFFIGLAAVAIGLGGLGILAMNIGWVLLFTGAVMFLIRTAGGGTV